MHAMKTVVLATTLVALAGCSTFDKTAICCDGGYEYGTGINGRPRKRALTWRPRWPCWRETVNGSQTSWRRPKRRMQS